MGRLSKKPLQIPDKVKVEINNNFVNVIGPLGKILYNIPKGIHITLNNNNILIEQDTISSDNNRLQGLTRGLIKNALEGVVKGYKKDLEIQGLGYKANIEGKNLILNVGFSHPVSISIPEGINLNVDKQTLITVSGVDKNLVGQFAAYIRSVKPPEPYQGTGIRYVGEQIIRKAGKAAATAGAAGGGAKK